MAKQKIVWLTLPIILALLLGACASRSAPAPTATPLAATPLPATPTPTRVVATPTPTPAAKLPPVMSIATAGVGTTSYIVASAFSEVISKYTGTKIAVEPSGAAARWIPLMKTK
ncbi:MAG: hypothetical protein Q7R34_01015, partial [Dehalococcoidia bacterium]|nr:hypothetical protein [Dehalococcoidia bacterium]